MSKEELKDDMSMSIGTQKRFHICRMIEICHNANVDRNNGIMHRAHFLYLPFHGVRQLNLTLGK